ncbi:SMP-30/gluconolactonase/LRE family protein [Actinokineospora sp. HUAS TT18]|uniref:SMP-30/gluconolactonase/LRE family protein n=1 Tax=Actinokineospora sp. HUAS TT18 TaxID=3447451 RepID=UPI003F528B26
MTDVLSTALANCVGGPPCYLGEGPLWSGGELSWVDITAGRLHVARWVDGEPRHYLSLSVDGTLGAAVPLPGGAGWLAMTGSSVTHLRRDGYDTPLGAVFDGPVGVRFNDAKCDPVGRLWAGTMHASLPGLGALYRFDLDGSVVPVRTGVGISNGLGWSPDGTRMYYVDSAARTLEVHDYDLATGELANGRPLVAFEPGCGDPDGLAVDAEGGIWVALWDGAQVRRYAPDGTLSAIVPVPASRPTSCAFAGPDLDVLVITTARGADLEAGAGLLYTCRPGVRGAPATPYLGKTPCPS